MLQLGAKEGFLHRRIGRLSSRCLGVSVPSIPHIRIGNRQTSHSTEEEKYIISAFLLKLTHHPIPFTSKNIPLYPVSTPTFFNPSLQHTHLYAVGYSVAYRCEYLCQRRRQWRTEGLEGFGGLDWIWEAALGGGGDRGE